MPAINPLRLDGGTWHDIDRIYRPRRHGGPMCRNIAAKHPGPVLAFDLSAQARQELGDIRARLVEHIGDIWRSADVVFLSLPGGKQVEAVCLGAGGSSPD